MNTLYTRKRNFHCS